MFTPQFVKPSIADWDGNRHKIFLSLSEIGWKEIVVGTKRESGRKSEK